MSRCRLLRSSREAGVISGGDGGFETESAVDARASFVELGRRSTLAAIAAMGRTPHPSHEEALGAKKPAGEAAAPGINAAAVMRRRAGARVIPRALFPLAAVGQEAPQAMARRMSTRAGKRSGEQLTSEDAFEATAGEKAEDAAEATPDEKVEDADEATEAAEATADEKAEATAVGLGTAGAQWPKAGMQTRSSHQKAPSAFV